MTAKACDTDHKIWESVATNFYYLNLVSSALWAPVFFPS